MDYWKKEGFFEPKFDTNGEVSKEGYFVIPIPPPNVTGALHCGHALATALQDCLIRWNRMRGLTTLYVPGCDHAGISTQSVVENILWRREKKTRHDLGRPALVERIWAWKDDYHNRIRNVLDRLGGSFDWSREAFTMDKERGIAVTETFVRLHEEGLIYRSNRLVNWCTQLRTSLSNLEVENKELTGRTLLDVPGYEKKVEFGVLTFFKYPIEGSSETIEVATTRPETMLGDTGIAVHPNDKRYQHLIGKKAKHPFVDRLLPIFGDDYVDPEFGTGAVKITPAHDQNDFTLGKRHNLDFINILNDDGTLNAKAGPMFEGKKRFDVRYEVKAELEKLGLYVKQEDNAMSVPLCLKSKDIIEPIMKPQWWMSMKDMAEDAIKVVKSGEIIIRPESAERNYYRWLESIQDWCLSRQLWWGHQCPAYLVNIEGEHIDETSNDAWVTGRTLEEAEKKAAEKFPGKKFTLTQDPDVLDTWFSSGLWPFATLGWPNQTHDLDKLFPTSVLETGWDILFFWVARMIMLSLKLTGKIPFKEVYCHSLIRDSEGRKMSKSLGNVIDPIDIMEGISLKDLNDKLLAGNLDPKELKTATKYQHTSFPQGIPECGADATRFALIQYTTGGGDISFDVKVIHAYRRFANKIYQATKYSLGKFPDNYTPQANRKLTGKESLAERWILHKLNSAARNINDALENREFSKSTQVVYSYIYDDLCNVYIENSKAIIEQGTEEEKRSAIDTLYTATEGALTMIHPFMPFLSEELWQRLPRRPQDSTPSITIAQYPRHDPQFDNLDAETQYGIVQGASEGIRSLITEYKIQGSPVVQASDDASFSIIKSELQAIKSLAGKGVTSVSILGPNDPTPTGSAVYVVGKTAAVFLEVKGQVDVDDEIKKAQTKLKKASDGASKLKMQLADEEFRAHVSAGVLETEETRLAEFDAQISNYERRIENLLGCQ
ncbi:valyl-tRNA synthetase [Microthyrium microscopicum]|uniref:valine--tRNA ligase n=1 Tax=Microthyrium microscopicum TaxID=703497 RepID=A0A6A6URT9_9PEZI|nr:valyl-tRNA synthetase [Microthyrium microscopicum]